MIINDPGYGCYGSPTIGDILVNPPYGSITGTIKIERYEADTNTYTTIETRDASQYASWNQVDTYTLYSTYGPGTQDICVSSWIGYRITFNGDVVINDIYGNPTTCNYVNLDMSATLDQAYMLPSVYLSNCV